MSRVYRVGALGFAHGHIRGLMRSFAELPNVEWVACADTLPAVPSISAEPGTRRFNLRVAQEKIGIPKTYDDYQVMLEREDFDIILFCPENARHGEVAEAVAARGIHLVTEKPMAATLSEALGMVRAARANNVELMVNWPSTWRPAIRKVKDLLNEGAIGDLLEVKWRNGASTGPPPRGEHLSGKEKGSEWWRHMAQGGGALLDYCCYGACLARWFIGEPAVAAYGIQVNLTSHYGDADDNAIIVVRFPSSLAILEGTWTTWNVGVPTGPIVYGTRGTLVVTQRRHGENERPTQVVEVHTTRSHGLTEPDQVLEGEPLPEGRQTLAREFLHHLETGEPLHPTLGIAQNLETMAILDAGIRSAATGKSELVNDVSWCIG
jgi:predicted dehydrogenase